MMESQSRMAQYLDWANEIEHATRETHRPLLDFLSGLDQEFRALLQNELLGPGPMTSAMLYMNSHGLFLSSVRIALCGQSPPVFMVLRGCIESAAYALLAKDPHNEEIYHKRSANFENKKLCADTFKFSNAMHLVRDKKLKVMMRSMYEGFIDLGAHPNISSIQNHLSFRQRDDGRIAASLTFLYDPSSDAVAQTLLACIETGIAILVFAQLVFPDYVQAFAGAKRAVEIESLKDEWIKQNKPDAYKAMMANSQHKPRSASGKRS